MKVWTNTIQSADGTDIYYEVSKPAQNFPIGSDEPRRSSAPASPTLFLVHGIGGDTDGWQYVRTLLNAQGYSTISIDVRGHGYSGHPKKVRDYKAERIDEDIAAVMHAEKIEKPLLVGHSGGAILSARYAAHHSDTISGLVLIAGSHRPPAYLSSKILHTLALGIIHIGAFMSPPPYKKHGWHSTYPEGKHHKEFEPFGLARTIFYNSLRSYLLLSRELITLDIASMLANISVPTLIIAGEHDGIFPIEISEDIHRHIKGSQLVVLPETNHVSILNNPHGVAMAILAFLTQKR